MKLLEILEYIPDYVEVYCIDKEGNILTCYDGRNSIESEYMDYHIIIIKPIYDCVLDIMIEK